METSQSFAHITGDKLDRIFTQMDRNEDGVYHMKRKVEHPDHK